MPPRGNMQGNQPITGAPDAGAGMLASYRAELEAVLQSEADQARRIVRELGGLEEALRKAQGVGPMADKANQGLRDLARYSVLGAQQLQALQGRLQGADARRQQIDRYFYSAAGGGRDLKARYETRQAYVGRVHGVLSRMGGGGANVGTLSKIMGHQFWGGEVEKIAQQFQDLAIDEELLGLKPEEVDARKKRIIDANKQVWDSIQQAIGGKDLEDAVNDYKDNMEQITNAATTGANQLAKRIPALRGALSPLMRGERRAAEGKEAQSFMARFAGIGFEKLSASLGSAIPRLGMAEVVWKILEALLDGLNAARRRRAAMAPILMGGMTPKTGDQADLLMATGEKAFQELKFQMQGLGDVSEEIWNKSAKTLGDLGVTLDKDLFRANMAGMAKMMTVGKAFGWEFDKSAAMGKSFIRAMGTDMLTPMARLQHAAARSGIGINDFSEILGDFGQNIELLGENFASSQAYAIATAAQTGKGIPTAMGRLAGRAVKAVTGEDLMYQFGLTKGMLGTEALGRLQSGEGNQAAIMMAGRRKLMERFFEQHGGTKEGFFSTMYAKKGVAATEKQVQAVTAMTAMAKIAYGKEISEAIGLGGKRKAQDLLGRLFDIGSEKDFDKFKKDNSLITAEEKGTQAMIDSVSIQNLIKNYLMDIRDILSSAFAGTVLYGGGSKRAKTISKYAQMGLE